MKRQERGPVIRGFTLIEAVIAVLIVGLVFVASLQMLGSAAVGRRLQQDHRLGEMLAHDLLSEIVQASYYDPQSTAVWKEESAETLLTSYASGGSDTKVKDDEWFGQSFTPSIPADAVDWKVTRVRFQAMSRDPANGRINVQLRRRRPNGLPGDTVFAAAEFLESSTGLSYGWHEVSLDSAALNTGGSWCVVFAGISGDGDLLELNTGGTGGGMSRFKTSDGFWEDRSPDRLMLQVYGTYSTLASGGGASDIIGVDSGEDANDRMTFDDIDDYHGWQRTPPESRDGTPVSGFAGWTRAVTVEHLQASDLTVASSPTGLKRITVRVTSPAGVVSERSAIRSEEGANDWTENDDSFTSRVGMAIQPTSMSLDQYSIGVETLNRPQLSDEVIMNGGFESGIAPWTADGSGTLGLWSVSQYEGTQNIVVHTRSAPTDGLLQDIGLRMVSGQAYRCIARTQHVPLLNDNVRIVLVVTSTGEGLQTFATGYVAGVESPGWAEINEVLIPTWTGDLISAYFKVESQNTAWDFGVDGASMKPE